MFEPRLRPIEPLQVKLSHQQYEDGMEDAAELRPVLQRYIDKILLLHTQGCRCTWGLNTTNYYSAVYQVTKVSPECAWHVANQ